MTEMTSKRYVGKVLDNNDPEHKGRVKLLIYGLMDNKDYSKDEIEKLPWAYPSYNMIFGANGSGSISIPKIGSLVDVELIDDDPYKQVYTSIPALDSSLIAEISQSYEGAHCLVYDSDEDIKIIYKRSDGITLYCKGNVVNLDNNGNITIENKDSKSIIELNGAIVRIITDDKVEISTSNKVLLEAKQILVDSPDVLLGGQTGTSPAVRGEELFQLLLQLATIIDAKLPPSAGVSAQLVQTFKPVVLSKTTKVK